MTKGVKFSGKGVSLRDKRERLLSGGNGGMS